MANVDRDQTVDLQVATGRSRLILFDWNGIGNVSTMACLLKREPLKLLSRELSAAQNTAASKTVANTSISMRFYEDLSSHS